MNRVLAAPFFVLCTLTLAFSQEIQVNRQNKTIAVIAEESVSVDPEIATVTIGYRSYGSTRDAALNDNLRVSEQVLHALLEANVPKQSIETKKLDLSLVDPDEKWTPEIKKERQFEARQSWNVTVPVSEVDALIETTIQAGANEISGATWTVANPAELQAKASGAALAKARSISEQMAKGLNAKLGDLVYASNKAPSEESRYLEGFWRPPDSHQVWKKWIGDKPKVEIYPEKVNRTATVYAVFSIE